MILDRKDERGPQTGTGLIGQLGGVEDLGHLPRGREYV